MLRTSGAGGIVNNVVPANGAFTPSGAGLYSYSADAPLNLPITDPGAGVSYQIQQTGRGRILVVPGNTATTLVSGDPQRKSMRTFGPGSILTITGTGTGRVEVRGDMLPAHQLFIAQDIASASTYSGTTPPHIYWPATNKTYMSHQRWDGINSARKECVRAFNHATQAWETQVDMFTDLLVNDDHGVPAICIVDSGTAAGILFGFGGTHSNQGTTGMVVASTTSALTVAGAEMATFTTRTMLAGFYSYAHPVSVAGQIYLFMRRTDGNTTADAMPLVLRSTSAITAAGVPTWNAEVTIATLGPDSRCYLAPCQQGTGQNGLATNEILVAVVKANNADTMRRNLYFIVYNTTTGGVRNLANTVTVVAASLPLTATQMDASFKVINQDTTNTYGGSFANFIDLNGNIHVIYMDGPDPTNGPYNLQHTIWNGTSWSTPVTAATTNQRFNSYGITQANNNEVEMLYSANPRTGRTRGGQQYRNATVAGIWGTPQLILPDNDLYSIDHSVPVKNATDQLRWSIGENIEGPAGGGSTANTSDGGILRFYAFGDFGIVPAQFQPQAETQAFVARMQVQPSEADYRSYDEFIAALKQCGQWTSLDALYIMYAHDKQAAILNAKQAAYNLTIVGNVAWTKYGGFKGDGTSSYLATGFVPSTAAGNWTLNAAVVGIDVMQETANAAPPPDMGVLSGGNLNFYFATRNNNNTPRTRFNTGSPTSPANGVVTNAVGYSQARRAAVSNLNLWKDGVSLLADTGNTTTALPDTAVVIGRHDTAYCDRRYGLAHFGGAISDNPATQAGLQTMNNAVRRLRSNLGAV